VCVLCVCCVCVCVSLCVCVCMYVYVRMCVCVRASKKPSKTRIHTRNTQQRRFTALGIILSHIFWFWLLPWWVIILSTLLLGYFNGFVVALNHQSEPVCKLVIVCFDGCDVFLCVCTCVCVCVFLSLSLSHAYTSHTVSFMFCFSLSLSSLSLSIFSPSLSVYLSTSLSLSISVYYVCIHISYSVHFALLCLSHASLNSFAIYQYSFLLFSFIS